MNRYIKFSWFSSVLISMALFLSACGGSETPTPADTPLPPTDAAPTAVPSTAVPPTAVPTTEPTPASPVAVLPTPAPGSASAQALVNTWVLAGPGTAFPVYGAMLGGVSAQVIGVSEDNAYWVVSVPVAPQQQGWVDATTVQAANADGVPVIPTPPIPPTVIPTQPSETDPQVTAIQNVYIRSGPGDTYPAYGIAPAGTSGIVLGVSEDGLWWTVRISPDVVGVGFGWVAGEWVTAANTDGVPVVKSPAPQTPATIPPPAPGVPTATAIDFVNIRSGPGTTYTVYGVAAPGATSEVVGKSEDGQWWTIVVPTTIASTGQAWVSASYTTTSGTDNVPVVAAPAPPPSVTPPPPPSGSITGTAIEPINVRSGPGTNYPSYGVAAAGSSAPVSGMSADGGWWQINVNPDNIPEGVAWVSADYVTVSDPAGVPIVDAPAPPTQIPPPETPAEGAAYGIALDTINVRSGPGNQYSSYGVVSPGATAPIIGTSADGSWWVVAIPTSVAPDGQGWVSAAYVDAYNIQNVPVIPAP